MWTAEEDQYLTENYKNLTDKEIGVRIGKDWRAISTRRKQLNLFSKRILVPWKKEEITYLKKYFHNTKINEIKKHINRTKGCIHAKARELGLKKSYLKNNIEILLNQSNESLYWIGFLLADGCFYRGKHKGSSFYLRIGLSEKDKLHLKRFAKYTGVLNIHSNTEKNKSSDLIPMKRDLTIVSVSVAHKSIEELMTRFNIKERKTYNPPDFKQYILSNEQFLSLIIGFIDGDGSITIGSCPTIKIGIHKSWEDNLNFIRDYLYDIFAKDSKRSKIYISDDYCKMEIGNRKVCEGLQQFASIQQLPIMDRKWSKIRY